MNGSRAIPAGKLSAGIFGERESVAAGVDDDAGARRAAAVEVGVAAMEGDDIPIDDVRSATGRASAEAVGEPESGVTWVDEGLSKNNGSSAVMDTVSSAQQEQRRKKRKSHDGYVASTSTQGHGLIARGKLPAESAIGGTLTRSCRNKKEGRREEKWDERWRGMASMGGRAGGRAG